MKVSLNTVKQYVGFELPPVDELVKRINEQLGGVEEVIDLGAKYKDAVIVKVVECEKHPDADRLSVCKVDAGKGELVQVVCGAPNVRVGMFAVWLPPESIVPSTYGTSDEFKLGARELRGVMSNGMLAAGDELAISNDHEGILEIDPNESKPSDIEIKPGASFAEAFGLNDTIIEIENKMFTHRPDLFGQLGVAREIFAILQPEAASDTPTDVRFKEPEWYWSVPAFDTSDTLELTVFNDAGEKVPRFMAVAMKDVEIKPSPLWLQCELVRWGSKPINNVVDLTNYIMLLTAQPTHAYDYDKLRGHKLGARMAKKGETIELLNGKSYELAEDDIVIVDGEGAVGLGGIMGGGNSEVSAETKNIVLEVANFDMYAVRKTSMRYGLFTDALTRFNKGQSKLQNDRVLKQLMSLMNEYAGAQQAGSVNDIGLPDAIDPSTLHGPMSVQVSFINERLGLDLTLEQIGNLLRFVNFAAYKAEDNENALTITAPFWRTDIELAEDIVEEVGRLYGFDKLPRELPQRSMTPVAKNQLRVLKQTLRESFARSGANEVLTYSFVHEKVLRNAGQDPLHAFKLSNALSPDLQYYRLSLIPSLLDKVQGNYRVGHDEFAIFEIGKTHFKGEMDADEPTVPNEDDHVALVLTYGEKQKPAGAAFYVARKYLEQIMNTSDVQTVALKDFDVANDEWGAQLVAAYDANRSAVMVKEGKIWGVVGEFNARVRRAFKLPDFTAGFEVHLDLLKQPEPEYQALSKYPSTARDISLEVTAETSYEAVLASVKSGLNQKDNEIRASVSPVSIYQSENTSHKTVTLEIKLTPMLTTLSSEQANEVVAGAVERATAELGARQV